MCVLVCVCICMCVFVCVHVCVFSGQVNALFFKQAFKGTEGKGDIGRCAVNRDFRLGQVECIHTFKICPH